MEELVSIVIPIYNVAPYLNRCIASVVNQTYGNLEIILVDDGSTDESPQLCENWAKKDSRIKVIHKANEGLGMARNTGLDCAAGKYVFFLDSDDYIDARLAEKCVAAAVESRGQVVVFGRYTVDETGKLKAEPIRTPKDVFRGEEVQKELLPVLFTYEYGIGVGTNKLYDLEFLKERGIRFPRERELASEDAYFALDLFSAATAVAVVREQLYYYCKRAASLSRTYGKERQRRNDTFLLKCVAHARKLGLPEEVCHHIRSRYHGACLGTLMLIQCAELPPEEKKQAINEILHSHILRSTLTWAVCRLDGGLPQIFWLFLKLRMYGVCRLLLKCRAYLKKNRRGSLQR